MWIAIYAIAVGLAASGLVGSLWAAVMDRPMTGWDLFAGGWFNPLCSLLTVIHTPLRLVRFGLEMVTDGLFFGFALIAAGLGWSFMQGVFIITTIAGTG